VQELRISDGELQGLIAPRLRKRLAGAGFKMGSPSSEPASSFYFIINLDLAGHVTIECGIDGIWIFRQDERRLAAIVDDVGAIHVETVADGPQRRRS